MSEKSKEPTLPGELADLLKVMIQRQDRTNEALATLAQDTREGFSSMNARLEALAVEVRGIRDDLRAEMRERMGQLEARVVKLEGRPARRPGARR